MQFGGSSSPSWSQRLTSTIVARLRELMAREEERFRRDADEGNETALLTSPTALRDVLGRRTAELGGAEGAASWAAGYIDDMICTAIGPIRAVAMLNNLWAICDDWRIPVAEGKATFGQRVIVIGYEFRTKSMRFNLTQNKVHLLKAWLKRLRRRRRKRVELREIASLLGTLVWCRAALPVTGKFLLRAFGLTSLHRRTIRQPKWLRFDLDSIEDTLDGEVGTGMPIAIPGRPQLSSPNHVSWSDACREPGSREFSGMAGFNATTGVLWQYRFTQREVEVLPIHILEAVGELVNTAFTAET